MQSSTRHPYCDSVEWDLESSTDGKSVTKAASTSGAIRGLDFRRRNFDNWRETSLGAQSRTCFLRPRNEQPLVLFSEITSNEAAAKKCLPKSRLSRLIIRDNLSTLHVPEMEVKAPDKTKERMSHLYDHLKKKFLTEQQRKLEHWRQESLDTQQYLDNLRIQPQAGKKNQLT
ncbi:uncharacterized protein C5orf52 homolog [Thomomys bottae]